MFLIQQLTSVTQPMFLMAGPLGANGPHPATASGSDHESASAERTAVPFLARENEQNIKTALSSKNMKILQSFRMYLFLPVPSTTRTPRDLAKLGISLLILT